jgi:GT2 family glycosyltransferase
MDGDELVSKSELTFCILVFNKTPWLRRSLLSIRKFCPGISYSVKLLSQGKPDPKLLTLLEELDDDKIELLTSPVNLGVDGGRKFLENQVETPLTMMLDDDMYLTANSIQLARDIMQTNAQIGALSMPQYDPAGSLISPGGQNLSIRNGVISMFQPSLTSSSYMEINHIDGGAMLYRTTMREQFQWDDHSGFLQDLDKSMQILLSTKWKQAIVTSAMLIHDRSWVGKIPNYEGTRFNGLTLYRNYEYFRRKWGLRLNLRTHVLYEVVYPALTLTRFPITISQLDKFIRSGKRKIPIPVKR